MFAIFYSLFYLSKNYSYSPSMAKVNSNPRIPFVTQESPFVNERLVL